MNGEPKVYISDFEHAKIGQPQKIETPRKMGRIESAAYRAGYNAEKRRLETAA